MLDNSNTQYEKELKLTLNCENDELSAWGDEPILLNC